MSTQARIVLNSIIQVYNRDEEVSIDELCKHSKLSLIEVIKTLRDMIENNVINFTALRYFKFKHTAYLRRGNTYKPVKYFNP